MLDSIYIGLTGLSTFSKGLNNISNNVANLNTTGYKRNEAIFQNLLYNDQGPSDSGNGNSERFLGNGVELGTTTTIFAQGTVKQSGNDQDAAINGNGLFILRQDGKTFYTRDGEFQFDADGYLVSKATGARVAVLGSGNQLEDMSISSLGVNPPKTTTEIKLTGNLSTTGTAPAVSDISVIDSSGNSSNLTISFTDNSSVTARSWLFQIKDQAGNAVSNGEVQFQGDGSPLSGFETFNFTYTPSGASAQQITLNFGTPGQFSGVTNFSSGADSTVKLLSTDGYPVGSINKITYDDSGKIVISYSNGQTSSTKQLALAWFDFLPGLENQGSNMFVNDTDQKPTVGAAKTSVFGSITGGSIESSNVDLTSEFSELIVVQRGYQASSQIISAGNDMIQQLFDMKAHN
jgi:flagellar hook protein FlgE